MTYLLHILTCFCSLFGTFVLDASVLTNVTSPNTLCPYTDYCTSNETKRLQDTTKTPCCDHCSCADDCWKRGNCCVDKQTIIAKQPLESCDPVLVNRPDTNYIYMYEIGNQVPRYYITKSCPTEDDPLEEKCSGKLQSSIEDFIWVTDNLTSRIYNNQHCAKCHGVNVYTPWPISTDCIEALNGLNSPMDALNYILSNCSLSVVPPSMKDKTGRCIVPEITHCNFTGEWETYDQALESACNSFSQIYLDESWLPTRIYRNVYCFLCNSRQDLHVRDVCTSYDETNIRSGRLGFTGILDFRWMKTVKEIDTSDTHQPGPVCAIDEISDPYQQGCLKLSCPIKKVPLYGNCVSLVSSTRFLALRARLLVYPKRTKTKLAFDESKYNIESVAEKVIPKIRKGLGLQKGRCQLCYENMYGVYDENMVPEVFLTDTTFYTSEQCQEDLIVERMELLLKNEIKMMFGGDHMILTVAAASPDEYDTIYNNSAVYTMTDNYCLIGGEAYDLRRFNACPSVSFNQENYSNLMQQARDVSEKRDINALFKFESTGANIASITKNFTVQICLESYMSVLSRKNDGGNDFPLKTLVFITLHVTCLCNILGCL